MNAAACLLAFSVLFRPVAGAGQESVPTFGTTVVISSGLRGVVYHIRHNTASLPDLHKLKPVGIIYTTSLNIPPQDFEQGFPGITKRFEWFAIDYTGKFWIQKPGVYRFSLLSDDGANLYIDDDLIADNDGLHPPQEKTASARLSGGVHRIQVQYFQGPRYNIALVLQVAGPGEALRVFSTDEFKPPPNPETWTFPDGTKGEKKQPAMK